MVRLSSTVLRQFKYWKRYMYREMYRDLQPRKVLLPIVGWKEDKVKEWNIDESQPWTQEFHAKNKPWVKKTSKMWVQPIKNWPYYKGDMVSVIFLLYKFEPTDMSLEAVKILCYLVAQCGF